MLLLVCNQFILTPYLVFTNVTVFQELCFRWPMVTQEDIDNRLGAIFSADTFTPADILNDRKEMKEVLESFRHSSRYGFVMPVVL